MSRGAFGWVRTIAVALVLLVGICAPARADVVTFGTQNVDHLIAAMSRTEGLFTYQATVGQGWEITTSYGSPPAALATFFNDETSVLGDTVEIRRAGGGTFTFSSVDYRTIFTTGNDHVAITGLLGVTPVGVLALTTGTTSFQTTPSGFDASPIDLLRVQVSLKGSNTVLMDNFVLTLPEPEPATACLAGAAGAMTFYRRRRVITPRAA
jgi:hypothetical protein